MVVGFAAAEAFDQIELAREVRDPNQEKPSRDLARDRLSGPDGR
jgi:hypothetical protein